MYTSYPEKGFQSLHRRMSFSLGQRRMSLAEQQPLDVQNWVLEFDGYDPKTEGLREALCTLGNGVFATRGACEMSCAVQPATPIKDVQENAGKNTSSTEHANIPSVSSDYTSPHYPGTYFNGYFNRADSVVHDRVITNEDLVNFTNWLPITFKIGKAAASSKRSKPSNEYVENGNNEEEEEDDKFQARQQQQQHVQEDGNDCSNDEGEWISVDTAKKVDNYKQWLNLKEGVLYRSMKITDSKDRVTNIFTRRFVHMGSSHVGCIDFSITPENWSGEFTVRASLDASVKNFGVSRYRNLNPFHFDVVGIGSAARCLTDTISSVLVITKQSHLEVATAMRVRCFINDILSTPHEETEVEQGQLVHHYLTMTAEQGQLIRIEKICTMVGSKDFGITNVRDNATTSLCYIPNFEILLNQHKTAFEMLWSRLDTVITPVSALKEENKNKPIIEQVILRLHTFHCLSVLSTNSLDRDVSVPARGIHGESYRGHIFWDELYIMPFFTAKLPEVARLIPKYRHKRLNMARINAIKKGFHGALFPWQSGSDGQEETQQIHLNPLTNEWYPDLSSAQYHGNIAIAYNILRYYDLTHDVGFMEDFGCEIVLEIAKMFSSMTRFNHETDRFEIVGVMGPDEYHESFPGSSEHGLRNNAYTNLMVVWLLNRSYNLLKNIRSVFRKKITRTLGITDELLRQWRDISHNMFIPFHMSPTNTLVMSQFEGYENLKELDWDRYKQKYKNIGRMDRILKAENDSPDHYKLSKQADVCMLFYLLTPKEIHDLMTALGYEITDTFIQDNVDYYINRTSHGSTLSYLVHAAILYGIDANKSWDFFLQALNSDYNDIQGGTTQEGIHLAIMAGTVDLVMHKFAGLDMTRDALSLNPCIPEQLEDVTFNLHWRNDIVNLKISKQKLEIKFEDGGDELFPIFLHGQLFAVNKRAKSKLEIDRCTFCGPIFTCAKCYKKIGKNHDHHVCRLCANVYCPQCTETEAKNKLVLEQFRFIVKPVRCCNKCYETVKEISVSPFINE